LNEGSFEDRAWAAYQLAVSNNQLAWLLANTDGDVDEALRCSQRSLELQPHRAGFLDTLGRCYYAKKDFENAVKYQLQAVALEPHSPLLIKQLELFQEALRLQQANADAADSADGAATDR
jgi:tetratricopeptide (TPR) repeat protein